MSQFIAYQQLVGGWVRLLFNHREEFASWYQHNPGSDCSPSASRVHGRCFGSEDHRDDWLLESLEDVIKEDVPMSQQPLFVDVHQIKESAQASVETQANPNVEVILPELLDRIYEEFKSTCSEKVLRQFNGRLERALMMAKEGKIQVTNTEGQFVVASQKVKGTNYAVDLNTKTCQCPDYNAGFCCKHRVASYFIQQALFQNSPELINDEKDEDVKPQIDEEKVEVVKSHPLDNALLASIFARPVVWAMAEYRGSSIPVQIIETNGEQVYIQALPTFEDDKLVPTFPFASPFGTGVPYSTTYIDKDHLSSFKIFGG